MNIHFNQAIILAQSHRGFSLIELMLTLSLSILTMFFLYSHYIILLSNVSQTNHKVKQFNTAIELQSFLYQQLSGLQTNDCTRQIDKHITIINAAAGQKIKNLAIPIRQSQSFANLKLIENTQVLIITKPSGSIPYRIENKRLHLIYPSGFALIQAKLREHLASYRWVMLTDCHAFAFHKLYQWDTAQIGIEDLNVDTIGTTGWVHPLNAMVLYLKPNARFSNYFDLYLYQGGYQQQLISNLTYWHIERTAAGFNIFFSLKNPTASPDNESANTVWALAISLD